MATAHAPLAVDPVLQGPEGTAVVSMVMCKHTSQEPRSIQCHNRQQGYLEGEIKPVRSGGDGHRTDQCPWVSIQLGCISNKGASDNGGNANILLGYREPWTNGYSRRQSGKGHKGNHEGGVQLGHNGMEVNRDRPGTKGQFGKIGKDACTQG